MFPQRFTVLMGSPWGSGMLEMGACPPVRPGSLFSEDLPAGLHCLLIPSMRVLYGTEIKAALRKKVGSYIQQPQLILEVKIPEGWRRRVCEGRKG